MIKKILPLFILTASLNSLAHDALPLEKATKVQRISGGVMISNHTEHDLTLRGIACDGRDLSIIRKGKRLEKIDIKDGQTLRLSAPEYQIRNIDSCSKITYNFGPSGRITR